MLHALKDHFFKFCAASWTIWGICCDESEAKDARFKQDEIDTKKSAAPDSLVNVTYMGDHSDRNLQVSWGGICMHDAHDADTPTGAPTDHCIPSAIG